MSAIEALAACEHPEDQRQRCIATETGSRFLRCSDCGSVQYDGEKHWVRPMLVAHVVHLGH